MLLSILNNLDLSAKKNFKFDALAHFSQHQKNYDRSPLIQEFSKNYRDNTGLTGYGCKIRTQPLLRNTFIHGQWDGYLDMMPEPYQWHSSCGYRITDVYLK